MLAAGEEALERFQALGNVKAVTLVHTNLAYNAFGFGDYERAQRHVDAGLSIVKETGDELELAWIRGNEGLVALVTDQPERAAQAFSREVDYARDHAYDEMLAEGLRGLAALFAARGRDAIAARILGSLDELALGGQDESTAELLQARFFAPSRERIGATAWDRARSAGAGLDRDAVVTLALRTARDRGERDAAPAPC